MPTKVGDMIRELEADGWRLIDQKGSHRHFKHPSKGGKITIAGKESATLRPGTEASIRRAAGLPKRS